LDIHRQKTRKEGRREGGRDRRKEGRREETSHTKNIIIRMKVNLFTQGPHREY
jgi:hypothetical protein